MHQAALSHISTRRVKVQLLTYARCNGWRLDVTCVSEKDANELRATYVLATACWCRVGGEQGPWTARVLGVAAALYGKKSPWVGGPRGRADGELSARLDRPERKTSTLALHSL